MRLDLAQNKITVAYALEKNQPRPVERHRPGPPRDGAPLERASVDEGGRARERGEAVREVEHFLSRHRRRRAPDE